MPDEQRYRSNVDDDELGAFLKEEEFFDPKEIAELRHILIETLLLIENIRTMVTILTAREKYSTYCCALSGVTTCSLPG